MSAYLQNVNMISTVPYSIYLGYFCKPIGTYSVSHLSPYFVEIWNKFGTLSKYGMR